MPDELKPCPFCGGEAHYAMGNDGKLLPWVRCRDCGVETTCCESLEEAADAWNRRVGEGEKG